MNEVEEFILSQDEKKREMLFYFHALFVEKYQLRPQLNFGIPFYYKKKWVLYLNPKKREGVDLCFTYAYKFEKYKEELDGEGRKQIRSRMFFELEEIDENEVDRWLNEALRIDSFWK
tara:strand:+ start:2375 stop:2725 length:351 start_codon:yes stop_codon:yes gene_type:complete